MSVSGTPNVLGAAGDAWLRFLGGTWTAAAAVTVELAVWTTASLIVAIRLIGGRDL